MRTVDVRVDDASEATLAQLEGYGLRWQDVQYPIYVALFQEEPSFFYQAINEAEQALLEAASGKQLLCQLHVSAQALAHLRGSS